MMLKISNQQHAFLRNINFEEPITNYTVLEMLQGFPFALFEGARKKRHKRMTTFLSRYEPINTQIWIDTKY
jgi:hypothetical protein